jgi:hypothetical protein
VKICTECDLPSSFLKAVVQREEARATACRMMEEACQYHNRAETAEAEVKRMETAIHKMRSVIDQCITELQGTLGTNPTIRTLERAYAEAPDPCRACESKRIIFCLGREIADLCTALGQAVSFARGCPPYGQKAEVCKLMKDPPGICEECWTWHLLEQAKARREAASA